LIKSKVLMSTKSSASRHTEIKGWQVRRRSLSFMVTALTADSMAAEDGMSAMQNDDVAG
jgi:hypothetical protein